MNLRCYHEPNTSYFRYGARGIQVEWKTFDDFFNDMYPTHSFELTVDRIDNDGNYSKENCRWATKKEQANNRRTNRYITYKGKTLPLAQWSIITGLKRSTITQRIDALGWDLEKAMTFSVAPRSKGHCGRGHTYLDGAYLNKKGYYNCRKCRALEGVLR